MSKKRMKSYAYVGPQNIISSVELPRNCIEQTTDIEKWIDQTNQVLDASSSVMATYIVDLQKKIWVADRHSEHVICARGQRVLAAGEIKFNIGKNISITYISNQSTGYCPEEASWITVKNALEKIAISKPDYFNLAVIFRRCDECGERNIVKDLVFECAICNHTLSKIWNFEDSNNEKILD